MKRLGAGLLLGATIAGCTALAGLDETYVPICEPGASLVCYTGPEGTEGVGTCKAGRRVCDALGADYGPCVEEVAPRAEVCATAGDDESCDGEPACLGAHRWSRRFGGMVDDSVGRVAVDAAGNVVIAGGMGSPLDFGGGLLAIAGGGDDFVVKLDASGGHVWSKHLSNANSPHVGGVAIDRRGNSVIYGSFSGAVDFGSGQLISKGDDDPFLVKLDGAGNHLWSKTFGGPKGEYIFSVAIDGEGSVVLVGYFYGSIDLGDGPHASTSNNGDAFVVKLDASGGVTWAKLFGGISGASGMDVAVDAAGAVVVTGSFYETVSFGGEPLTSAGDSDGFIVKLDASGGHVWSKRFGDMEGQSLGRVTIDGAGDVVLAGGFHGTLDLGGGALTVAAAGGNDVYVAKLKGSDGSHVWSKSFGDADDQNAEGLAVDNAGNIVVTGDMRGSLDFGGGALTSAGEYDSFFAKLDPAGGHVWSRRAGDVALELSRGVAVDAAGNVVVAGIFNGTIDVGGGALASAGERDFFVAKLAP